MKRIDLPLILQETTGKAIGAFYGAYNELSGYPEYVLKRALVVAFADAGLIVREEVQLPVLFRGRTLTTFRADLIIDPGIIVEVKTAPELAAYHKAQVLHYLKASDLELGLLFNFGKRPEFARIVYQGARKKADAAEVFETGQRIALDRRSDEAGSLPPTEVE